MRLKVCVHLEDSFFLLFVSFDFHIEGFRSTSFVDFHTIQHSPEMVLAGDLLLPDHRWLCEVISVLVFQVAD
jgi:hypothetical protein